VSDPHPVKAILAGRGITNRRLSGLIGYGEAWTGRIVNGYVQPVPTAFAEKVAGVLGLPVADLFHNGNQAPDRAVTLESDLVAFVEASRLAQGLPTRLSDPTTLQKVATILASAAKAVS
jgi:hypothetical protein